MLRRVFALVSLIVFASGSVFAQSVPSAITYQGKLTDASGSPVPDNNYQVQFKLYLASSGGSPFWTSQFQSVSTSGGLFTTTIEGTSPALTPSVLSGKTDVWLETVVGGTTLTPRVQFASSPFAFRAGDLALPFSGLLNSALAGVAVTNQGSGIGVYGSSATGHGLYGDSSASNKAGVFGTDGLGYGVWGSSANKYGVYGTGSKGVYGLNPSTGNYGYLGGGTSGTYGQWGTGGPYGALGTAGEGVYGSSSTSRAIFGDCSATDGAGVWGSAASGYGVRGSSASKYGVYGTGSKGVYGENPSSGNYGYLGSSTYGVYGDSGSSTAYGALGVGDVGAIGHSETGPGVFGESDADDEAGVQGSAASGYGVYGSSANSYGVFGSGKTGVYGEGWHHGLCGASSNIGVRADGGAYGVWAYSSGGYAGYFNGKVYAGAVGIGTEDPGRLLHVLGTSYTFYPVLKLDNQSPEMGSATGMLFSVGGSGNIRGKGGLAYECTNTWNRGSFHFLQDATADMSNPDLNDAVLTITNGGSVGVGTKAPSYKLHVNGSVAGVGPYHDLSDLRYKKDITMISGALDTVSKLRGVTFDWRRDELPELNFDDGRQIGFIAQEVEKVLPEVVSKDDQGYYSVAYSSVVPVLVEALKEQQKTIDDQQRQLDELTNQVAALMQAK